MNNLSSNQLIAAVDFSEYSQTALAFAATLADRLQSKLTVLHVIHDSVASPGYYNRDTSKDELQTIEELAKDRFTEFMDEMRRDHPELEALNDAETLLVSGVPVPRILEVVENINPDMVVMGSLGRTGLAHVLLGSKAERVAQLCPVPVTIVKQKKSENNQIEMESQ
ncbi:MAG: universal stress protein [SAR324 cluster bacterium]|nr:universal stress protein [SAR324 cluster bacterium]MBL7036158.1 universal stress protein [SAR324 cluster bacterium]